MKKILLLLIPLLLLASCDDITKVVADITYNDIYEDMLGDFKLTSSPEWDSLDTHNKISAWVNSHIAYYPYENTFEDPQTTINRGSGNCKGFALVYMNIIYYQSGRLPQLVIAVDKTVVEGGKGTHAVIIDQGICIEPQTGRESNATIGYRYSFWEVFKR